MPTADDTSVERLLRAATGEDVRVVDSVELAHARGPVRRVVLDRHLDGIGSTVMSKQRDDNALGGFASVNMRSERAALECLAAAGADVAPRIVAADEAAGLLVTTDVGIAVEATLFGDDPVAARLLLVALGCTTGRLHRTDIDAARFAAIDTWTIADRTSAWDRMRVAVDDLGFPPVTGAVDGDRVAVLDELREPGPATVLVHGDLVPNNAVVDAAGTCRLVDFESSCPRHLGMDAAMLRFPFAWYGRWATVPPDVQRDMETAYREELRRPPAEVDAAIAVGCLAMTALRLERLPVIADESQAQDLAVRRRTQIVSTIDVAVDAARTVGRAPHLTAWFEAMAEAMRQRWAEARLEPASYPAFAEGTA